MPNSQDTTDRERCPWCGAAGNRVYRKIGVKGYKYGCGVEWFDHHSVPLQQTYPCIVSSLRSERDTLTEKLDKAREALQAYVDDHDDAVTDINRKQGLDHPEAECDCDLCLNARPLTTLKEDQ